MSQCNMGFFDLWQRIRRSFCLASQQYFSFPNCPKVKLAIIVIALTVTACSGGGGGGGDGGGVSDAASSNFVVSGTVSAPNGDVAFLPRKNLLEQFADAFIAPVHAALSGFMPVAEGTKVELVRISNDGTVVSVLAATTTSGGRYSFDLTALGISAASDLVIQVLDSSNTQKMRAFVATANVDINPVSETAARIVLELAATSALDNFTTQELADIYSALYLFVMTQALPSGADIESTVSAFTSALLADSNIAGFINATADAGQTARGPGDIGNYFPFDEGTAWVYQGTELSNGQTTNYSTTVQINGTYVTGNGVTTTIFRETNPANSGIMEDDYFIKDSQSITNYGTSDVSDFLIPQVVPYPEYIFPLGINSSFVTIDKTGLSWADEYGDQDGKPEKLSIRAIVTVVGFEDVTVPAGTYANAVKIVSNVVFSVILSGDGATATETITSTEWYAPGVGLVKRAGIVRTTAYGATDVSTVTEELSKFSKPLVLASISVGLSHSCGLTPEGKAYCWGNDSDGQLGIGKVVCNSTPQNTCPPSPPGGDPHPEPTAVTGGLTFTSLALSGNTSCGIAQNGTAYCWGNVVNGILSSGIVLSSGEPVPVPGGMSFISLSTVSTTSCGVIIGGAAYCWGTGTFGQLGNGYFFADSTVPVPVAGGHLFTSISAGEQHVCALSADGTAHCWGRNYHGGIGDGTQNDSAVPVLSADGMTFSSLTAGGNFSCGMVGNGDTYCWGADLVTGAVTVSPALFSSGLSVRSISGTHDNKCLLTAAGSAYCNGYGYFGQLGNGTMVYRSDSFVPVSGGIQFLSIHTGGMHSCGVATNGIGFCWGENTGGQLGDGTKVNKAVPVPVLYTP